MVVRGGRVGKKARESVRCPRLRGTVGKSVRLTGEL